MSKVEKVFELLGVAANEEIYLFDDKEIYRITDRLEVEHKLSDNTWEISDIQIGELLQGDFITKIPKSKLTLLHDEMLAQNYETSLYTFLPADCFDEEYKLQGDMGTQEEMLFLKEKRQVEAEIKFLQKKYPDNEWNGVNIHYFISYDIHRKKAGIASSYNNVNAVAYMPSKEKCIELLDTITEERYKKYILQIKEN